MPECSVTALRGTNQAGCLRCEYLRLTHRAGRPYHLPAPVGIICGMALPVAPT
jgi:hypothetical protein